MRDNSEWRATWLDAISVEFAMYVALVAVAWFVRWLALDGVPLNNDEARHAVAALNFVRGTPAQYTGSPLLFVANAIVFALFGATDLSARTVPALIGSVLVVLPAFWRAELGRVGALTASALLAISPSLVFFSRQTDPAILAVTFALAALGLAWRASQSNSATDLNCAAACAALAMLSAPDVWTMVLALTLLALALRAGWIVELPKTNLTSQSLRSALMIFAAVFIGVSTVFLLHRQGVGAAFDLLTAWLNGWVPGGSPFDPFRALVIYDPIPLFFGVAALIDLAFAFRSQVRGQLPLAAFALWSFVAFGVLSFSGDKTPSRMVVVIVPLTLIAGWYIGMWLTRLVEAIRSAPEAIELVLSQEMPVLFLASAVTGFIFLLLAEFSLRGSLVAADNLAIALGRRDVVGVNGGAVVAFLILLGIASVTFVTVATVGFARAKNVGVFFVLTIFLVWTVRQNAFVNFSGAPHGTAHFFGLNPQDLLVTYAASPNVRDLVNDLEDVSRWRANDTHALVFSADTSLGAMIEWNLRNFPYARFGANPVFADEQALVLAVDAPAPGVNWISQRYHLETTRSAQPNFLRWLLFRDPGPVDSLDVLLWIPTP